MKKIKKASIFFSITFLLTINCLQPSALAQGPGFGGDVEDTPIDGGVTLIAAAAAGYGIKKIRDKNRNK